MTTRGIRDPEALALAGECDDCDGTGAIYWRWKHEDTGECTSCDAGDDLPVCQIYEDGHEWECLACARADHQYWCGCDAEGWA